MEQLYFVAGISRQYYFKAIKTQSRNQILYSRILEAVLEIRESHPRMGARSLHKMMNLHGEIGVNRFERYLQQAGLGIEQKRSFIITTNSNHPWLKYKNLLYGIKLTGINQVWSSDITYFIIAEKVFYIIFIEDVYSRRILGYAANDNMFADNNIEVLLDCIKQRGNVSFADLIHHSDKGSQYCSKVYISILEKHNIKISMAETSLENAYVERLNGTIKNGYLYPRKKVHDLKSLRRELDIVVKLYNEEKPHSKLGMLTPVEFENQLSKIKMQDRKVLELHDFTKR